MYENMNQLQVNQLGHVHGIINMGYNTNQCLEREKESTWLLAVNEMHLDSPRGEYSYGIFSPNKSIFITEQS